MKIVSYNINGIRSSTSKGLLDFIQIENADIYCFQEVRASEKVVHNIISSQNQVSLFKPIATFPYNVITNCGNVPGYAGTMILSKKKPKKVVLGIDGEDFEGRTITAYYDNFILVNSYVPNGSRLDVKYDYLDALERHISNLIKENDVIFCSDFNIAHTRLDLTQPDKCSTRTGFLPKEREVFDRFMDNLIFTDAVRYLHDDELLITWRPYKSTPENNEFAKYRFDYILCSSNIESKIKSAEIKECPYSDHIPVIVDFDIN